MGPRSTLMLLALCGLPGLIAAMYMPGTYPQEFPVGHRLQGAAHRPRGTALNGAQTLRLRAVRAQLGRVLSAPDEAQASKAVLMARTPLPIRRPPTRVCAGQRRATATHT
jgi:hypothetical protein